MNNFKELVYDNNENTILMNNQEQKIIFNIGNELKLFLTLFEDLKLHYDNLKDDNEKILYCLNIELFLNNIKGIYPKGTNIKEKLLDCNYNKSIY